jgi:glycyl-tRNA synthetase
MANQQDLMEKIVSLAKRRGFIYPSSEIYGGINGFWDYGPLGVELKRNIKDAWWHDIVRCPATGPDGQPIRMVGLDCSIIMNPKVWEASGHVGGFADPMQTCRQCKRLFRADQVWEMLRESPWVLSLADVFTSSKWEDLLLFNSAKALQWAERKGRKLAPGLAIVRNPAVTLSWLSEDLQNDPEMRLGIANLLRYLATEQKAQTGLVTPCPNCGGDLTEPRQFNLMFKTSVGAVEDPSAKAYLRPETAQGIFVNYKNVLDTTRIKVPFGIAQIGKAFRNEINPRNFTFRSREFEQMEIEFFCHPGQADKWYEYWRDARFKWYTDHGLKSSKLRLRNHEKEELAHYARSCADIEYEFPFGISELEGVANRTDFDLKAHQNHPACLVKDLSYFDDETKERFIPYVIEPSGGVDRATLAFLCEAYAEDEAPDENGAMQKRTVLRFHPRLAPVKVAVFPLVRKDGMPEKAQAIYQSCAKHIAAFYDEKGAVGRRYRRQDEAGTPFCVTVDGQTNKDGTVTIRDRDTMQQVRIPAEGVLAYVRERLHI